MYINRYGNIHIWFRLFKFHDQIYALGLNNKGIQGTLDLREYTDTVSFPEPSIVGRGAVKKLWCRVPITMRSLIFRAIPQENTMLTFPARFCSVWNGEENGDDYLTTEPWTKFVVYPLIGPPQNPI